MLEFLRKLFIGHSHRWEIHQTLSVYADDFASRPCRTEYHLRCKECGNIKVKST